MVAFADMDKPSAKLRRYDFEHPPGTPRYQIWFICPGCNEGHGISEGWSFDGDYERPTFAPSFLTWLPPNPEATREPFISGKRCHSFIRAGMIEFQSDCSHALAGQTVPLPDWSDDRVMGDE